MFVRKHHYYRRQCRHCGSARRLFARQLTLSTDPARPQLPRSTLTAPSVIPLTEIWSPGIPSIYNPQNSRAVSKTISQISGAIYRPPLEGTVQDTHATDIVLRSCMSHTAVANGRFGNRCGSATFAGGNYGSHGKYVRGPSERPSGPFGVPGI